MVGGGGLVTGGDGEVMERVWERPGKLKVSDQVNPPPPTPTRRR